MRVVLTGGGTGGHIYPLLAIAEAAPDWAIDYIGNAGRLEAQIVPRAGLRFHAVPSGGIRGKRPLERARGAWRAVRGTAVAARLVRRLRPQVVVSSGGYAAFPVTLAAWLEGVPLVLVEPNASPGLANRVLMRHAARILVGFEAAIDRLPAPLRPRAVATGVPIRPAVYSGDREAARAAFSAARQDILIAAFGGSQGARAINESVIALAPHLGQGERIVLAAGQREYSRYEAMAGGNLQVMPYFWDIAQVYAAADLVVARAGALTCAELIACGLPSVLVPSPNVVGDHQTKNARVLSDAGAASLLPEAELTPERLWEEIEAVIHAPKRRRAMAASAKALGRPDAASRAVEEIARVARRLR